MLTDVRTQLFYLFSLTGNKLEASEINQAHSRISCNPHQSLVTFQNWLLFIRLCTYIVKKNLIMIILMVWIITFPRVSLRSTLPVLVFIDMKLWDISEYELLMLYPEDLSSVPSTRKGWFMTSCKDSSRGPDTSGLFRYCKHKPIQHKPTHTELAQHYLTHSVKPQLLRYLNTEGPNQKREVQTNLASECSCKNTQ